VTEEVPSLSPQGEPCAAAAAMLWILFHHAFGAVPLPRCGGEGFGAALLRKTPNSNVN